MSIVVKTCIKPVPFQTTPSLSLQCTYSMIVILPIWYTQNSCRLEVDVIIHTCLYIHIFVFFLFTKRKAELATFFFSLHVMWYISTSFLSWCVDSLSKISCFFRGKKNQTKKNILKPLPTIDVKFKHSFIKNCKERLLIFKFT